MQFCNLKWKKVLVLCLFLFGLNAQSSIIDSLSIKLTGKNDQSAQVDIYSQLANEYLKWHNNYSHFDSFSRIAISTAESSFKKPLILKANKYYLSNQPKGSNANFTREIILRTEELVSDFSDEEKLEYWLVFANAYLNIGDLTKSNKYSLKAISSPLIKNNIEHHIKAQLCIGKVLKASNQYVEAFQYFINALSLSNSVKNESLKRKYISICHEQLFKFHQTIKNFDEAAKYKKLIIESILDKDIVDSIQLNWQYYDLAGLNISSEEIC